MLDSKIQNTKSMELEIAKIRQDFPTLVLHDAGKQSIHYMDNAATTLKPRSVLEAMQEYYVQYPANIHRGVYSFSQKASDAYEQAREKIARFINAPSHRSIVFTSGTTASSNLFSHSFINSLEPGDEIITSVLEHHSNLVNWQVLCRKKGIILKYLPLDKAQRNIDASALEGLITPKTKLLTVTMASNTLGVVTPIQDLISTAKKHGVLVCADMAQAVSHFPIDVQALDIDFGFFSGHKIFGPTGIGIFYGKLELFKKLEPFFYGGGMVTQVDLNSVTFQGVPEKFEAGTPPIAQAIGLGAALDYVQRIGFEKIQNIETYLTREMKNAFHSLPKAQIYIEEHHHLPIFSFNLGDVHAHDVASILDENHIAVRTGQHCTHILLSCMALSSTARASLAFYNNQADIIAFIKALEKVLEIFYARN